MPIYVYSVGTIIEDHVKFVFIYLSATSFRWSVVIDTMKELLGPIIKEENLHELEVILRLSRVVSLLYENVILPSYHIEYYQGFLGRYMKALYNEPEREHFLRMNNELDHQIGLCTRERPDPDLQNIGHDHFSLMALLQQINMPIHEHAMKCLKNRCKDI